MSLMSNGLLRGCNGKFSGKYFQSRDSPDLHDTRDIMQPVPTQFTFKSPRLGNSAPDHAGDIR